MKIQIEIRNVYGNETAYPACRHAKFLAAMAGTATLTPEKLSLIAANGYEIEVVAATGRLVGLAPLAAAWSGETARQRRGGTFGS